MSVVLSEHLPLLATAPDGIKKLRQLVLQLAIEGRITDSDKSDWTQTTLGDVGDWGSGGTPLKAHTDYYGGTIPWLVIGDLNDGLVTVAETHITEKGLANSSAKRVPVGTLLIAMYGSIGKLGIAGIECATNQAIAYCKVNSAIAECRFLFYFLRAIRSQLLSSGQGLAQQNISQKLLKATPIQLPPLAEQGRIVAKVDELMALCDRLESEQSDADSAHAQLVETLLGTLTQSTDAADLASNWQRIAKHFDTLFTTEGSIEFLRKSILHLAVLGKLVKQDPTDEPVNELLKKIATERKRLNTAGPKRQAKIPHKAVEVQSFELPKAWTWVPIGTCAITSTGRTPATAREDLYGGRFPFIGPGQISSDGAILTSEKYISEKGKVDAAVAVPGSILMVCIGGSIGKCAVVHYETAFNQQINAAVPILFNSRYLYVAMTSPNFQEKVISSATGSATPIINKSNWENLLIPMPPLQEQHRIVAKVDELMALCDRMKEYLREARGQQSLLADTLIDAVLVKAYVG